MMLISKLVLFFCVTVSSLKTEECKVEETYSNVKSCDLELNNRNISSEKLIFLEWSKIIPDGYSLKVNQTELDIYKNVIDNLLVNEFAPIVVLYSGKLPQVFSPLGGWTNPTMVKYFSNYARQMFKLLGNRVKNWITFYEPRLFCESFEGLLGDEFPIGVAEYLCAHNIIKAHSETYHIYDKVFRVSQHGTISIALDVVWVEPANNNNLNDFRAVEQMLQFKFGLYANPITNLDYPTIVKKRIEKVSSLEGFEKSRLPEFNYNEKLKIHNTVDYLWINLSEKVHFVKAKNKNINLTKTDIEAVFVKNNNGQIQKKQISKVYTQRLLKWIEHNYERHAKLSLKI